MHRFPKTDIFRVICPEFGGFVFARRELHFYPSFETVVERHSLLTRSIEAQPPEGKADRPTLEKHIGS